MGLLLLGGGGNVGVCLPWRWLSKAVTVLVLSTVWPAPARQVLAGVNTIGDNPISIDPCFPFLQGYHGGTVIDWRGVYTIGAANNLANYASSYLLMTNMGLGK